MTSRRARGRAALAAVAACAVLAGCGAEDPIAVPAPETTQPWPWEKYPPTPTPTAQPSTPTATPSATEPPQPSRTETPTPTGHPTPSPTPRPTADPTSEPTSEPTADATETEPDEPDDAVELAAEVVELTNEARAEHGCEPLELDDRLTEAARSHSEDMAGRDYFDHVSPEGDGPGERAERAGYDDWSGENIAKGYTTAAEVVEGWMDSDGHRENILNCDSQVIGVGVAEGSGDLYWTQMFGFE